MRSISTKPCPACPALNLGHARRCWNCDAPLPPRYITKAVLTPTTILISVCGSVGLGLLIARVEIWAIPFGLALIGGFLNWGKWYRLIRVRDDGKTEPAEQTIDRHLALMNALFGIIFGGGALALIAALILVR